MKETIAKYEAEVRRLTEEMKDQNSKHKYALETAQAEFDRKERELKGKCEQLADDLDKTGKAKKDLERQYADMKSLKDDLQKNLEKTIIEIENMKKIHQDELRGLMMRKTQEQSDMEAKYKAQLDKLIKEQIQETEEMKAQFANVHSLLDQKYKQLEERFEELQELYDTRPSRNEDLELIRTLQEQCSEKDNQLKKAAEDMKFYKLELMNREDSYNKVFGSKPVVGIYNPLEGKVDFPIFCAL